MDFAIHCHFAAIRSYDLAASLVPSQAELDARAEDAHRALELADRTRRIASLARTKAVKSFRAADRAMDRFSSPLELLRAVDAAERSIAGGTLPADLADLAARMVSL